MTQQHLPMPIPEGVAEATCRAHAVVLWHLKGGGTVVACEEHRLASVPEGRFTHYQMFPRARCGWTGEA